MQPLDIVCVHAILIFYQISCLRKNVDLASGMFSPLMFIFILGIFLLFVNIMRFDLFDENLVPHVSCQLLIVFNVSCISLFAMFMSWWVDHMAISSAYNEYFMCCGVSFRMSFISNMKSVGLMTLPCGTPFSCVCNSDSVFPILTLKVLCDIKLFIKIGRFPLNPRSNNFC